MTLKAQHHTPNPTSSWRPNWPALTLCSPIWWEWESTLDPGFTCDIWKRQFLEKEESVSCRDSHWLLMRSWRTSGPETQLSEEEETWFEFRLLNFSEKTDLSEDIKTCQKI